MEVGEALPSQRYAGSRLAVFLVRPLTQGSMHDGSQAVLLDVLRHFGRIGVSVTVYCGRIGGRPAKYPLAPSVDVHAILPFNEQDQDPYRAAPFQLANVIDIMRRAAADHDVLYVHDSNLRFRLATAEVPTVSAIFDFIYGHTVAGVLDFGRDRLVAISEYLGDCVKEVFGRFRPLPDDSLHVVPTGFETRHFRPRDPRQMRARLGLTPETIAVLWPHRPEEKKGGFEALSALAALRTRLPADVYARVRLLVPDWRRVGDGSAAAVSAFYDSLLLRAADTGVSDKLLIHEWIPRTRMPGYYSCAAATLCIGTFPEAFGNVHIESMLCGTPSVVSRVAAQRKTVPEELTRKVDPGQPEAVSDQLAEIIERGERVGRTTIGYLRNRYSARQMLRGYERALLECSRGPEIPAGPLPNTLTDRTLLRIPPWAALLSNGYYHDYAGYSSDPRLLGCVSVIGKQMTFGELAAAGLASAAEVHGWLGGGHLVSCPAVAAEWN
jgi:glycosyltransferase involved in cell wall biosynthesis